MAEGADLYCSAMDDRPRPDHVEMPAPEPAGVEDAARNRSLCIHPLYRHRPDAIAFDDRDQTDYWQNEVYEYAHALALREGVRSVADFGCGSGFKLMKYFGGFQTCGWEIEPALSFLEKTYPGRLWVDGADMGATLPLYGDMVICSDVIEHMNEPIALLKWFASRPVRCIILSTPALEILAERGESPRLGPPDNQSHINEWTTLEFRSFVEMHLRVIQHIVVSCRQGTQLIVAAPK